RGEGGSGDRAGVAVAERDPGVEMHRRPLAGHLRPDHESRRARLEQVLREDARRLRGAPLAVADEDDAVTDRHDVAALDPGRPPVVVGAAEPDLEVGVAEARMAP